MGRTVSCLWDLVSLQGWGLEGSALAQDNSTAFEQAVGSPALLLNSPGLAFPLNALANEHYHICSVITAIHCHLEKERLSYPAISLGRVSGRNSRGEEEVGWAASLTQSCPNLWNWQPQTDDYPLQRSGEREGTYPWSLKPEARREVAFRFFLRYASPGLIERQARQSWSPSSVICLSTNLGQLYNSGACFSIQRTMVEQWAPSHVKGSHQEGRPCLFFLPEEIY